MKLLKQIENQTKLLVQLMYNKTEFFCGQFGRCDRVIQFKQWENTLDTDSV